MRLLRWLLGIKPIFYDGGTGESPETAVIIRGAGGAVRGVPAEYSYLEQHFGQCGVDWRLVGQRLKGDENGKHYDVFRLAHSDGREFDVYFDISDFFGKL